MCSKLYIETHSHLLIREKFNKVMNIFITFQLEKISSNLQ
jgi:hypothetical protein